MAEKVIAIVSGGMDSVTMAYLLREQGHDLHLVTFDYGQRHRKEVAFAEMCAKALGAGWSFISLDGIIPHNNSALTSRFIDVPDGHYTDKSMKITIVPNRNAIMLSVAYAVAVAMGAGVVAIGVHNGDFAIYPDCRPVFIDKFAAMENWALEGVAKVRLLAPFLYVSKAQIVITGHALGVPYQDTWSCYKGGEKHCGRCATDIERREAFMLAGVADPTEYAE